MAASSHTHAGTNVNYRSVLQALRCDIGLIRDCLFSDCRGVADRMLQSIDVSLTTVEIEPAVRVVNDITAIPTALLLREIAERIRHNSRIKKMCKRCKTDPARARDLCSRCYKKSYRRGEIQVGASDGR